MIWFTFDDWCAGAQHFPVAQCEFLSDCVVLSIERRRRSKEEEGEEEEE